MAQWMYRNQDKRSVVVNQYPLLREKTGPILPLLMGPTASKLATGEFQNFLNFLRHIWLYFFHVSPYY